MELYLQVYLNIVCYHPHIFLFLQVFHLDYFHQYISFYDTSGELLYTGFKTFEDLIYAELIPFEKIDSFMDMSDDYAKNIIQQQGDFKTNFRGFVDLDDDYKLFVFFLFFGSTFFI